MALSFVKVSLLMALMVKLVLSAMCLRWLMMIIASFCSHSLMAVSHLDKNVGSSFSTTIGLMVILSFAGVLPLEIALDRASW